MVFEPCEGGCNCGRVRYALRDDPITLYACHCTDCQSETGSSFALSMFVTRDSVEKLSGELRRHAYTLPDGRERHSDRCVECDVALWGLPRRFPDLLNLQAGTLDDTAWLTPVGHIWTRSAQPWVVIADGVLSWPQQPDDVLPMVRAWKARLGS